METLKLALPLIAIVLVAVAARGYRRRQDRGRGELVSGIAEQRDWRYFADEPGLVDRWPGKPFGRGSEQQVTNVVRGSWGTRKFLAFDYSYVVNHTYNLREQEHVPNHFGVVVMQLPGKLPWLEVEHETVLDGLDEKLRGPQDIQFESDEFNAAFKVTAADTWYARQVIQPRMMDLILQRGEIGWRIMGGDLLAWDRGRPDGDDLVRRLNFLADLIEEIPRSVWSEYAGPDPAQG